MMKKDMFLALAQVSLRTNPSQGQQVKTPAVCPAWFNGGKFFDMNQGEERHKAKSKRNSSISSSSPHKKKKLDGSGEKTEEKEKPLQEVTETDERFVALQSFVKNRLPIPPNLPSPNIVAMSYCEQKRLYFAKLDTKYCENKGGEHNTVTVWVQVSSSKMQVCSFSCELFF
jgi:hypothetical protein